MTDAIQTPEMVYHNNTDNINIKQAGYLVEILIDNDCYSSLNHLLEYLDLSRMPVDVILVYLTKIKKYIHKEILSEAIPYHGEFIKRCIREFNDRGLDTKEMLKEFL